MKKIVFLLFMLLVSSQIYAQIKVYWSCEGGESGRVLSHANGRVSLQNGYRGEGEAFIAHIKYENNVKKIALECCGGEKGKYLSHANGKVFLQNGCIGDGELWVVYTNNGKQKITACGGESGKYLSHANGKVQLMNNYRGDGELWHMRLP